MKTWKDIEEAARFDAVLHEAVTRYQMGELTQEQALIHAALVLVRIRQEQHQQIVDLMRRLPASPIIL